MLSTTELNYDIGTKQPAYVVGTHFKVTAGRQIPVRIPHLMPDIHRGDNPVELINPANRIFVNDRSSMPALKHIVYIDTSVYATLENNAHTKHLPNMRNSLCGDFKELMTTVSFIDGERVTCDFFNRSVYSIDFNTNE